MLNTSTELANVSLSNRKHTTTCNIVISVIMKLKIIKNSLPGKASRLLEVKKEEEDLKDVGSEFERSFDSLESDIQIINGSFSTLKPITDEPIAGPSGLNKVKPIATSTPILYENISDEEMYEGKDQQIDEGKDQTKEEGKDQTMDEDLNSTYNDDEYKGAERESSEEYFIEITKLIFKTQDFLMEKKSKRAKLKRKLVRYQKKVAQIKDAIMALDKCIKIGQRVEAMSV